MRFAVTFKRGVALCDATDRDDAEEHMEREYGRQDGPYEAEPVGGEVQSMGFGQMRIHRTDAFDATEDE